MMRTFRRNLNLKSTAHRARNYQKSTRKVLFCSISYIKSGFYTVF